MYQATVSTPFQQLINPIPPDQLNRHITEFGYDSIAGVDEAGRGPLAGPVVACACILPKEFTLPGLTDSKKCTPKKRDALYQALTQNSTIHYAVSVLSHEEIDRLNILQATLVAMSQSISLLSYQPSVVLIDGNRIPKNCAIPTASVIKGDQYVAAISAASIIAKVTRDRIVDSYDELWPHFCFKAHKGYGTKLHFEMLRKYGPLPIHRKSFEPVKSMNIIA